MVYHNKLIDIWQLINKPKANSSILTSSRTHLGKVFNDNNDLTYRLNLRSYTRLGYNGYIKLYII